MSNLQEEIEFKKQQIEKQEDFILQQEMSNDSYYLSRSSKADDQKLNNLKQELYELQKQL